MSQTYNCSTPISNNTCIKLIDYCTTEYISISDICKCLTNSKLYINKCTDGLDENVFAIIIGIVMTFFICGFLLLCCVRLYHRYIYVRNRRIHNLNNQHNQNNNIYQLNYQNNQNNLTNYDEVIIHITQKPPEYDEISIYESHNLQNRENPPPYNTSN